MNDLILNQNLVEEKNGELFVSSLSVALNVGYEHRAVIQLINTYKAFFEEFRPLHFKCIGIDYSILSNRWI